MERPVKPQSARSTTGSVAGLSDVVCSLSLCTPSRMSDERRLTNEAMAKPSQAKVLTEGGDMREAQVDVPLSVSRSCV
jgi:hypothetical protein